MSLTIKQASLIKEANIPMFFVSDGIVSAASSKAELYGIMPGQPVMPLLCNYEKEYADLTCGKLYCKLKINGNRYNAAISYFEGTQLFVIDTQYLNPVISSDAVYLQNIRGPLDYLFNCINELPDNGAKDDRAIAARKSLLQILRILDHITQTNACTNQHHNHTKYDNIVGCIDNMIKAAQEAAPASSLEYHSIKEEIFCKFAPRDLEVAIYNLIANAIQYGNGNVLISLKHDEQTLYISVQNTVKNQGTPAVDIHSYLAEDPNASTYDLGTGHGIQIARNIALRNNGTLHMQCINNSVTFTLSLPTDGSGDYTLHSPTDTFVEIHGGISTADVELSMI